MTQQQIKLHALAYLYGNGLMSTQELRERVQNENTLIIVFALITMQWWSKPVWQRRVR